MSELVRIHAQNPQQRLLRRVCDAIRAGGVVVYPTDSSYALGCAMGHKAALERIRRIRQTERDHEFTLVCRDLSAIATYARVDHWAYRLLRSLTPGPYTFILKATRDVPKRLQDPKKRSIGIRVPDHKIAQAILEAFGEPIMSSTLLLPGDDFPMTEAETIRERLGTLVDVVVDGGVCGMDPTTVIDLSKGEFTVVRRGKGDVSAFEA
jgi:tRNA threonylcarbamoyl adenosine modification protein (Sua5/YciO/YrdC/YwlC family)